MNITIHIPDDDLGMPQSEAERIIEYMAQQDFPSATIIYQVFPGVTNKPKEKAKARDQREVVDYCLEQGLTEDDGGYFWDRMLVNDWKIAKQPVRDWKAAVRTWKRQGYFPSQKQPQRQQQQYDHQFPTG